MTAARKNLVLSLLVVLLAGHVVVNFTRREWWPYSRYPMYSHKFEPNIFSQFKLMAVNEKGEEWAPVIRKTFWPFWESALMESFGVHDRALERRAILKALVKWASHSDIKELRLYRMNYSWKEIEAQAAEKKFFDSPPRETSRELITGSYP